MDRSIKPGDIIVVGDGSSMGGSALPGGVPNVGRVARIGVRAVNIITRDGKKHLIPNELLMTQAVENWSYASPEVRRSEEDTSELQSLMRSSYDVFSLKKKRREGTGRGR